MITKETFLSIQKLSLVEVPNYFGRSQFSPLSKSFQIQPYGTNLVLQTKEKGRLCKEIVIHSRTIFCLKILHNKSKVLEKSRNDLHVVFSRSTEWGNAFRDRVKSTH